MGKVTNGPGAELPPRRPLKRGDFSKGNEYPAPHAYP
jgi:hypothetical protein